jgi:hypothetical protein
MTKLQALDARWIGDQADLKYSTLVDYEIEHYARLATRCEYKACCAVD